MALTAGERGAFVSEINVTPMADVIIVLLIIFMVVIPMLPYPEGVTLPAAAHGRAPQARSGPVELTVRDDGTAWMGATRLDTSADVTLAVHARLGAASGGTSIARVSAGARLPYARVLEVVEACREAGVRQVLLTTVVEQAGR